MEFFDLDFRLLSGDVLGNGALSHSRFLQQQRQCLTDSEVRGREGGKGDGNDDPPGGSDSRGIVSGRGIIRGIGINIGSDGGSCNGWHAYGVGAGGRGERNGVDGPTTPPPPPASRGRGNMLLLRDLGFGFGIGNWSDALYVHHSR